MNPRPSHPERNLVLRSFVEGLRPGERTRLRAHVSGCASCGALYDRLGVVERVMAAPSVEAAATPRLGLTLRFV